VKTMKERLAQFSGLMWHWTCCSPAQEPVFRALLERLQPKRVIEIGTHQGVSAGLLAEYAENVITVDVIPNPVREQVWKSLGVQGRIRGCVHKSQGGRDAEIAAAAKHADLAFVDGSHLMRDVEYDFDLVVRAGCRRVILHDYWENAEDWPDVKAFVDGVQERENRKADVYGPSYARHLSVFLTEIHKPFAYVEVVA
jgi:hypothetical protein